MKQAKKTFLVGFSGGADSTAALLWTLEHCPQHRVIAVHFNHHLRGDESDAEAVEAEKFAKNRDIPFRMIDLNIAPGGNLEARARQARLEAWQKLVAEYENAVVITGHHRDDCIENMFLRIGRGSNVSGLTGLQLHSVVEGVNFFRPLLIFDRGEIEEFLRKRRVKSWATDSSNLECDYARNVLRNKILPELYRLFPGGKKAVEQSLSNLTDDAVCLDNEAYWRYKNAADRHLTAFWKEQPRALTVRMLKYLCKELFDDDAPLSSGAVERFEEMVRDNIQGICVLDGSRQLLLGGGKLQKLPEKENFSFVWHWQDVSAVELPGNWRLTVAKAEQLPETCGAWEAFFNPDALPEVLSAAPAEPGEKMVPFGRKTPVLLKKLRVDAGVPSPLAPPVLKADGKVIWFPGVRRSNLAPVDGKCRIIRFFMEKSEKLPGKNL